MECGVLAVSVGGRGGCIIVCNWSLGVQQKCAPAIFHTDRVFTGTESHARTHARTHARAHTHTHTEREREREARANSYKKKNNGGVAERCNDFRQLNNNIRARGTGFINRETNADELWHDSLMCLPITKR
jgi:hypothetical protein